MKPARPENWEEIRQRVEAEPGVIAAAPIVEMEGMIRTGRSLNGVMVHGVLPEAEQSVSGQYRQLRSGRPECLDID